MPISTKCKAYITVACLIIITLFFIFAYLMTTVGPSRTETFYADDYDLDNFTYDYIYGDDVEQYIKNMTDAAKRYRFRVANTRRRQLSTYLRRVGIPYERQNKNEIEATTTEEDSESRFVTSSKSERSSPNSKEYTTATDDKSTVSEADIYAVPSAAEGQNNDYEHEEQFQTTTEQTEERPKIQIKRGNIIFVLTTVSDKKERVCRQISFRDHGVLMPYLHLNKIVNVS